MSQLDDLMEKYVADLKNKCNIANPDMTLLTNIAKSLGPSIYNRDSSIVATSDEDEVDTVRNNFLIKKLGLADDDKLDEALEKVIETYGRSNPNKQRVVMYYLLTQHFKKENVFA